MRDIPIDQNYRNDWTNFLIDVDRYVFNINDEKFRLNTPSLRFNAICPVMNLTMHFEGIRVISEGGSSVATLVVEELGILPCAIGWDFLELVLRKILEGVNRLNCVMGDTIGMKIKVIGVRASLVQSVFIRANMLIPNKNKDSRLTRMNEWDIDDPKRLFKNLKRNVAGYLPMPSELNSVDVGGDDNNLGGDNNEVRLRRDQMVRDMITRSSAHALYFKYAWDKSTIVPPVLQLKEEDLIVNRNGKVVKYTDLVRQ